MVPLPPLGKALVKRFAVVIDKPIGFGGRLFLREIPPARVILEWSRPTGFFATFENDSVGDEAKDLGRNGFGGRSKPLPYRLMKNCLVSTDGLGSACGGFMGRPFAKQIWPHDPHRLMKNRLALVGGRWGRWGYFWDFSRF